MAHKTTSEQTSKAQYHMWRARCCVYGRVDETVGSDGCERVAKRVVRTTCTSEPQLPVQALSSQQRVG